MIKVTGIDKARAMLEEKVRQLEEIATPAGAARRLTEKHAHLVCAEHGERPAYSAKPEGGGLNATYCCEALQQMASEAGFKLP